MPTKRAGLLQGLFFLTTAAFLVSNSNAQTLFSYGNHAVDRAEFLKAFSRNNADVVPSEESYREYLSLYIRFKLKVQAALDARLDTSSQQKEELSNFRSQILDRYMTDETAMNALVKEAMERSRKELLLYHIFLSIPSNATEEEAKQIAVKADQLYDQLSKGEDFQRLAVIHSQDPEVVRNKGRVGYISAFVLPYTVENIVYKLPEGGVSRPYRSNIGIHLFKNGGIKEVAGQLKIAHILIAFPPDADMSQEEKARQLADSLYAELKKGADFKDLAFRYSKDNITYLSGGEISDFGTGLYDPAFEEAARLLAFDSAVSVPVKTAYGFHIIRRLGLEKPVSDTGNAAYKEKMRQRVMDDDRNDFAKATFIKNILQQTGFKKSTYPVALFNRISDSVLKGDSVRLASPLTRTSPLFSFSNDKTYTFGDWLSYLQVQKENGTPLPARGVEELYSRYVDNAAIDYYSQHLERYNKEFAAQLNEFRDGNLLFEIMQKKIWDVASDDTAGLRKYYTANASKYWWSSSADVVVFTTSDETIAELMARELLSASFDWRKFVQEHNGSLQADSGRFELDQLPVPEGTKLMPATLTAPMRNEIDNNLVFCLVLRMYPEKEQRNFSDARGFVINDYQNFLEDQWINSLRKKYPVKINEAVLRSLPQGGIK